jgi:hypothetical protein
MACKCLYRADVSSGVEQIADEGAPPVVRAEGLRARLLGTPVQRAKDGLVRYPPQRHPPTLAHGREEGPGSGPRRRSQAASAEAAPFVA